MRLSLFVRWRIAAICLTLGLNAAIPLADPQAGADETSTVAGAQRSLPTSKPPRPTLHAELYQRILTPVRLDFHEVVPDEVLRRLSRSCGVEIELVNNPTAPDSFKGPPRPITLTSMNPVSLLKAIQLSIAGSYRCILLGDNGVRIVDRRQAADQYVLETHEFRAASAYTTRMRTRFIDQVRREVTPDDWAKADGPWIVPSRSVFAVDVYHNSAAHERINDLLQAIVTPGGAQSRDLLPRLSPYDLFEFFGAPDPDGSPEVWIPRLRRQLPLESVADRLRYEDQKASPTPPSVSEPVERRLVAREAAVDRLSWKDSPGMTVRAFTLRELHNDTVEEFTSRAGFGITRGAKAEPAPFALQIWQLGSYSLASAEIDSPSPEPPTNVRAREADDAVGGPAMPAVDRLERLHEAGLEAFLFPFRFGYVQDREHVAGFGSHGFEYLPRLEDLPSAQDVEPKPYVPRRGYSRQLEGAAPSEPTEHWAMRRLELISLLKHDPPRAYQSDNLPRMDVLQEMPTRQLGEFETLALPRLAAGEDLVVRATINRIEMVGAIRAARQCTECHSVQRGQLLGAFAYTLVRDPWAPSAADSDANRPN